MKENHPVELLTNLIDNGIKYNVSNGSLTIILNENEILQSLW